MAKVWVIEENELLYKLTEFRAKEWGCFDCICNAFARLSVSDVSLLELSMNLSVCLLKQLRRD